MSELENRFVKKGLWVNQNYGAIKGTVITTDTKTGTLVIALLAILSTIGSYRMIYRKLHC